MARAAKAMQTNATAIILYDNDGHDFFIAALKLKF
jgi:hypothetical protein